MYYFTFNERLFLALVVDPTVSISYHPAYNPRDLMTANP
jgi:hypothetical protein